ncbi:MAG: hypothetical protein ACXVEF_42455 [Polyangiales bacterium]
MSEVPSLVSVRVKSRTGDVYVRGGLFFRHDAWSTVEVALEVALKLHGDPWLDVRDIPADFLPNTGGAVVGPDGEGSASREELKQQLEAAHATVTALDEQLRVIAETHVREIEALREAHRKELAALAKRRSDAPRSSSARAASPAAGEDTTE